MKALKSAVRRLLDPAVRMANRYFDKRFSESENRIVERIDRIVATGSASTAICELLTHLGQRLRQLVEATHEHGARLEALETMLLASRSGFEPAAPMKHFFEGPYVLSALSKLERDARVLVVGGRESAIAVSLASLGFRVTQIEGGPVVVRHGNLESLEGSFAAWDASARRFDAVVCLASAEPFGTPATKSPSGVANASQSNMSRLESLLEPGGTLVLTAAFGPAAIGDSFRIADLETLDHLLDGLTIDDLSFAACSAGFEWKLSGGRERAASIVESASPAIVLVKARNAVPRG